MMKRTIFYVVFAGLLLSAASCGNQKQSKEDKADLNEFNNVQLLSADYGFAGLVANIAKQYEGSKFYYDVVVNYNGPLE